MSRLRDAVPMKPTGAALTIDEHAIEYLALQANVNDAKERLQVKKDELVKLCRKKGAVPIGAEKSLRLLGDKYQVTTGFGMSSSVDQDVVLKIHESLVAAKTPRLFMDLFHEEPVSYIVAPTAIAVLEKLPPKIRELWNRVVALKPKEPSLKVEKRKK